MSSDTTVSMKPSLTTPPAPCPNIHSIIFFHHSIQYLKYTKNSITVLSTQNCKYWVIMLCFPHSGTGSFLRAKVSTESFLNPECLVQGLGGREREKKGKGKTEGKENKAQICLGPRACPKTPVPVSTHRKGPCPPSLSESPSRFLHPPSTGASNRMRISMTA